MGGEPPAAQDEGEAERLHRKRRSGMERGADLEQGGRGETVIEIVGDIAQQPRQEARPQEGGVRLQRVGQAHGGVDLGRGQAAILAVHHVVVDRLAQPRRAHGDAGGALDGVERQTPFPGRGEQGEAGRDGVVTPLTGDLLDQIDLAVDVAAEGWRRHRPRAGAGRDQPEAEPLERAADRLLVLLETEQGACARGAQGDGARRQRSGIDVEGGCGDRAAGDLRDDLRRPIEGRKDSLRIGPALEAVRGVGPQSERPCGAPHLDRIEPGALEEDVPGRAGDLAGLPPHHPRHRHRPGRVGDHQHLGGQGTLDAVQREQPLAGACPSHDDPLLRQAIEVERVQRLPLLPQDEIRRVDDVVDRALAYRLEPLAQPVGGGTDAHAEHGARGVARAQVGSLDDDGGGLRGRPATRRERRHRGAQRGAGERGVLARHAEMVHAVGTVGEDVQVVDRVVAAGLEPVERQSGRGQPGADPRRLLDRAQVCPQPFMTEPQGRRSPRRRGSGLTPGTGSESAGRSRRAAGCRRCRTSAWRSARSPARTRIR